MSHLYRWVRSNKTLAARSSTILRNGGFLETSSTATAGLKDIKPLYQIVQAQSFSTSRALLTQSAGKPGAKGEKDDYVIKFREVDIKGTIKKFYSLYGPLFVVCHIGVALTSLGFFCSLSYLVDLSKFIPNIFYNNIGPQMSSAAETGGKFFLAYAVHKAILPLRLIGSITLTRFLSKHVEKYVKNLKFFKLKNK